MATTTTAAATLCGSSSSTAPRCRRQIFGGVSTSSKKNATTKLLKSAAAAIKQPHRRSTTIRTDVRASAFSRDHHSSPSWSSSRKQLVEALTQGSALARAPCAWYVDKTSDINSSSDGSDGRAGGGVGGGAGSVSRSAGPVGPSSTSASSGSGSGSSSGVGGGLRDRFPVMRVNARQTPVSHAALAHADSTACDELRAELERHLRDGGATVLVTPIVDPLIMDSTSFGGASCFPSMEALDDDVFNAEDVEDALSGSGGKSLGSFSSLARSVDFDGTVNEPRLGGGVSSRRGVKVLVEGTVCKCDPNDPGDCCARGLATYCTSCPVLASCDDPAHASVDALDGVSVDCAACGASAGAGGYVSSSSRVGGGIGECAFARAIKAAAATHTHRHQYYAAIVQTSHGVGVNATVDGEDDDYGTVVDGVGYEEFLVHRPAGDAWIAGALPPPTSVRRASFGPQLRGELRRLAVQRSVAGW